MSTSTPQEGSAGFQRRLGLFDATMLVAGTMIGSGIFVVSAEMARDLGSSGWLLAVWVVTGVMTIMGALSYAELAGMMPQAGGQYVYLREAYSPLWGFQYGWTVFLVIQTGSIAAVAIAFAKFLGVFVPQLGASGEAALLFKKEFAEPFLIRLPLPWLSEPLTIFERKEFTIYGGQLVGVAVIVLLTLLNCRGVQEGKLVQNVFTLAKIAALALLIAAGLTVAANAEAIKANLADPWSGIWTTPATDSARKLLGGGAGLGWLVVLMVCGGAMVGSLFSADAWNNITFTAGEVRNPERNLGRSLFLGTGLVIVLYLLANVAYLAALPLKGDAKLAEELRAQVDAAQTPEARAEATQRLREATFKLGIDNAQDDRVGTAALQIASPRLGVGFMAIAIMISTFGCINGMILMGGRLYYAMARDGLFFEAVGRLNERGVPAAGLFMQGLWAILLVFTGTYNELLDYVIFAALLFYVLTVVGLFVLRRTKPDAERPYKAFGYPVVPALYVLLCATVMVVLLFVRPKFTWPGLIIVLTGIPVYYSWRLLGKRGPNSNHTHG